MHMKMVEYPDSDGKPMSDNTKQARWIVVLFGNIAALFRSRADVFVAMDLLWYAVEGFPEVRAVPDVMVAFGRPKGDRGSYKQWEEDGVPVTVAIEILSPGNTHAEMIDKFLFYEEHGVEEYYEYDPDRNRLFVFLRQGEMLRPVRPFQGFVSPRLGIRFDLSGPELLVYGPDGQRFLSFEELKANRDELQADLDKLQADRDRERQQRLEAEQRAEKADQRATRLAELSRKARRQQASPEEMQELERLENGTALEK